MSGQAPTINLTISATPAVLKALGPLLAASGVKIEAASGKIRVTVYRAAEISGCHHHTIREAIDSGELPAYRPGKEIQIELQDLEEWIQDRQVVPRKDPRLIKNPHPKVARLLNKSGADING